MSKWPDKYPSNCRLQHAGWIGYVHTDWPDDERCPVCRLMDEAEHLRAALAAAESKLSDCRASVKVCDVCGEETSTWEGHALKAALADEKASRIGWAESAERWRNHYYETLALLADERRHADALKEGLAACVGERATFYAGQSQTVTWAVAIEHAERLLSEHRARRAAAAPLSDAGASSEVANGTA